MEFETNLGGNLAARAKEGAEALRELKGSLGATGDALKKLHDEQAKAAPPEPITVPGAPQEPVKRPRGRPRKPVDPDAPVKSPKKPPAPSAPPVVPQEAFFGKLKSDALAAGLKGNQKVTEAYYAKVRALEANASKDTDAKRSTKAAKDKAASSEALTLAKGAALAGAAALGIAGVGSIAKIALGYKGMFALQGVAYQASLSFRRLFSGVNPAPVIRGAQLLGDQLKKTSVTGAALDGLITRGFNGLFSVIEKSVPYVVAFTQGIVLGMLYAENAVLRARIALAPYSGILDGIVSSSSGLETAAIAGGAALVVLGANVAIATAPLLPFAAALGAIAAALEQVNKLSKEWDENSGSQLWAQLKQDLGGEKVKPKGLTTGADYDAMMAAKAKASPTAGAAGVDTGKQLAAGIIKGMSASEAEVAAGGGKLALAANTGVRDVAKIKSPSRMMEQNALFMGQGVERGLDKSRAGVQAAAERSLVPNVRGASAGGSGARASGNGQIIVQINSPLVNVVANGIADLEAAVMSLEPRMRDAIMRGIALGLGVPAEA